VSQPPSWLQRTPNWVWWAFAPILGGLAISFAGYKAKVRSWVVGGVALAIAALILAVSSNDVGVFLWGAQIGLAFYIKKPFLLRTYPRELPLPDDRHAIRAIAATRSQIDINNCSKDDLVRGLGLPIVYANDIEELIKDGHLFTDFDELIELVGIPEEKVRQIAPLVTFGYYTSKEVDVSWRRLNSYSADELTTIVGLDANVAQKIVSERQRGQYQSVLDVKRRTGLPLNAYRQAI